VAEGQEEAVKEGGHGVYTCRHTIVYGGSSYASKQSCSTFSSVWWWYNDALTFGHPEIFQQVQYGELATFRELAKWVTRFAEDGVNWSNALPEVARTRAHYAPVSVINGSIFPVGTHPFLADQEFQVQYARFLADTIARCLVWTTGPR
jgi:hypothetical protein